MLIYDDNVVKKHSKNMFDGLALINSRLLSTFSKNPAKGRRIAFEVKEFLEGKRKEGVSTARVHYSQKAEKINVNSVLLGITSSDEEDFYCLVYNSISIEQKSFDFIHRSLPVFIKPHFFQRLAERRLLDSYNKITSSLIDNDDVNYYVFLMVPLAMRGLVNFPIPYLNGAAMCSSFVTHHCLSAHSKVFCKKGFFNQQDFSEHFFNLKNNYRNFPNVPQCFNRRTFGSDFATGIKKMMDVVDLNLEVDIATWFSDDMLNNYQRSFIDHIKKFKRSHEKTLLDLIKNLIFSDDASVIEESSKRMTQLSFEMIDSFEFFNDNDFNKIFVIPEKKVKRTKELFKFICEQVKPSLID